MQVKTPSGAVVDSQTGLPISSPLPTPPTATPVTPPTVAPAPASPVTAVPTANNQPQDVTLPAPSVPVVPTTQKPYTVVAGDTLTTIAQKFGVPITDISGYSSGDPNKIIAGETLTIGQAPLPPAPVATPTTATPSSTPANPTAPVDAKTQAISQLTQPGQNLKEYGIDPNALSYGFNVNPQATIKDLVTQIMSVTGLPDAKRQITDLSTQVEELSNKRDAEIAKINDNPFISEGTKNDRITAVTDSFEKKISNRVDRVKLLQGIYDSAKQEAQFAATTAINLYDKNRNFDQSKLEFAVTSAEKALDAQNKLHPDFSISNNSTRFQFNPDTGKYEKVASTGKSTDTLNVHTQQVLDGFTSIKDYTTSEQQSIRDDLFSKGFSSDTAPSWYKDYLENEKQMSLPTATVDRSWLTYRNKVLGKVGGTTTATSTSTSTSSSDALNYDNL